MAKRSGRFITGALLLLVALAAAACGGGEAGQPDDGATAPEATERSGAIDAKAGLKVAFIGDSANGDNFRSVLRLIQAEGANAIVHSGDFDYGYDADGFFATIDEVLGPDFPYFVSTGNHDEESWNEGCGDPDGCYATYYKERLARTGQEIDDADVNDEAYSMEYGGLKFVFVGQRFDDTGDCDADPQGYACFIREQLDGDGHVWKICDWHKNQHAMQVGGKSDEMGWAVYQACIDEGAIIMTGHEHSYHRTKTLTNAESQTVDAGQHPPAGGVPGIPDEVRVGPGRSFVVVSGLGGNSMRDQERCLPPEYPYGCHGEWARIYTTNQTGGEERFGALFMEFGVDGDPARARGYFKNADGEVIDEFVVLADR